MKDWIATRAVGATPTAGPRRAWTLAGKRVGVIGTGATAVQLIPEIAGDVAHLTVFQRTANYCVPLRNSLIDRDTQDYIKSHYPEIFEQCLATPGSFMHEFDPRSALTVSEDEKLEQYERLWAEPGFKKWLSNFYDIMMPGEANEDYARVRPQQDPRARPRPRSGRNAGAQESYVRLQASALRDRLLRGV